MISTSVHILSCNGPRDRSKYKGYDKVINSEQIASVPLIKNDSIIHVAIPMEDNMNFKYNDQLEDISFVKLETTKESKINNLDKIIISKDRIMITDKTIKKEIYIFDRNGKFINAVSGNNNIHGQQVHITNILDVTYDFGNEEIILHDQSGAKLYYFDKNGNFKHNKKEYLYFVQFANIPETNEYVYINPLGGNEHLPMLQKSSIYLGEKNTKIQFTATDAITGMKTGVNYMINKHRSITNSNYRMFYVPEFSNRVYRILGKKGIREELIIDLPSPNTFEKLKNPNNQTIEAFVRLTGSAQYYHFTGDVLCNEQDIYFIPTYRVGMSGYFYSKKKKRIIGGGNLSNAISGDTAKLAGFQYPISTYKDHFISVLYPADLILKFGKSDATLAAIQKKSKPDDNPVIVLYKIKE